MNRNYKYIVIERIIDHYDGKVYSNEEVIYGNDLSDTMKYVLSLEEPYENIHGKHEIEVYKIEKVNWEEFKEVYKLWDNKL